MFITTPVYRLNDVDSTLVFGLRQPVLSPANGDVSVGISSPAENRLDLVSQELYGQPNAWWAMADTSQLLDPLAGVIAGSSIRAPDSSRLPV